MADARPAWLPPLADWHPPRKSLLAFIDCETTGLDPERHEVWEVALALWDQDERCIVGQYVWQLPVLRPSAADPEALRIGGFEDRRWADFDMTDLAEFAAEFADLVRGCPLMGANPAFDAEFLARIMYAHSIPRPWHYRVVDLEAAVVGYFYGAQYARPLTPEAHVLPWSSTRLSEALGVVRDPATMHSALGDVLWCVQLWKAVTSWAA